LRLGLSWFGISGFTKRTGKTFVAVWDSYKAVKFCFAEEINLRFHVKSMRDIFRSSPPSGRVDRRARSGCRDFPRSIRRVSRNNARKRANIQKSICEKNVKKDQKIVERKTPPYPWRQPGSNFSHRLPRTEAKTLIVAQRRIRSGFLVAVSCGVLRCKAVGFHTKCF